jgi:hypothetical protein
VYGDGKSDPLQSATAGGRGRVSGTVEPKVNRLRIRRQSSRRQCGYFAMQVRAFLRVSLTGPISELSERIVREYLVEHKFCNWTHHSSTKKPVTLEEKKKRAADVAAELCSHEKWLSHSYPIKIADMRKMKVVIDDYGDHKVNPDNKKLPARTCRRILGCSVPQPKRKHPNQCRIPAYRNYRYEHGREP